MTREELYDDHLKFVLENIWNDHMTDDEFSSNLDRLIMCMPNQGKLYRYRKINTEKDFEHTYDALKKGYIWFSNANNFLDAFDMTIRMDSLTDEEYTEKLLDCSGFDIGKFCKYSYFDINNDITHNMMQNIFGDSSEEIFNAIKNCPNNYISDISLFGESIVNQIGDIDIDKTTKHLNESNRCNWLVASLCTSYKQDVMWQDYADGNGICIEYDYTKLRSIHDKRKQVMLNTFRVNYTNKSKTDVISRLIDAIDSLDSETKIREIQIGLMQDNFIKSNQYKHEKEWRICFPNVGHYEYGGGLYLDIVSSIIIDEKALYTQNGIKIINLCNDRNWNTKVRIKDYIKQRYKFIPYEEYMKRGEKDV